MSPSIYFGHIVKRLREERGLSQEGLAYQADLNRSYVGEVERGTVMPSLGTVLKISKALNLSASSLLARYEVYAQSQLELTE